MDGRKSKFLAGLAVLTLLGSWASAETSADTDTDASTRITDPKQHACKKGSSSKHLREEADYILKELDLRPGDTAVDIGAGDGWWAERMAKLVGQQGVIHAGEVDKKKVDQMKKKFKGVEQLKPYLCPTTKTGLPDNSCDLAFLSSTYHHLDHNGHVDYLRHLRKVLKPTGRVVVIEKNPVIATHGKAHGTRLSELVKQAEEAGWVAVRTELISGTYQYIAIFVQKDLFPPEPTPKKKDGKSK